MQELPIMKTGYTIGILLLVLAVAGAGYFGFRSDPVVSVLSDTPFRKVYLVRTPGTGRVSLQLVFQTGAADQPPPPGLLHYGEHLVWLSAFGRQERSVDRHSNAWTDSLSTGYLLDGERDALPELVASLARVLDPVDLPVEFMLEERDIVQREYDLRLTDNIDARVGEALKAAVYTGNPYAVSIMGTSQDIAGFTPEAAMALTTATHRPEKAVLLVTGDVSPATLRAALPDRPPADAPLPPLPAFTLVPGEQLLRFPDDTAEPRMIWRRIVRLDTPQPLDLLETQLALLRDMLDTSLPGGLAGPLRYDAFVTSAFDISLWPLDGQHVEIRMVAYPDTGVTLEYMRAAFEAALEDTIAAGFPERTFTRVLARFETYWPDWQDRGDTADWMAAYVADVITVRREPLDIAALQVLREQMDLASLNNLLKQFENDGRTVVAYIGPEGDLP